MSFKRIILRDFRRNFICISLHIDPRCIWNVPTLWRIRRLQIGQKWSKTASRPCWVGSCERLPWDVIDRSLFGPRAHILWRYTTKCCEWLATALTITVVRMWVALMVVTLTPECKGSEYRPFNDVYSPNIIRVTKTGIMRWAGHVTRMGERNGAYWILEGKSEV